MMGCGSGRPIATQISAGIDACQIIQSINPDLPEAQLHLKRTINYLVGPEDASYDQAVGGMQYGPSKGGNENQGLGKGIIPDLTTVQRGGDRNWLPADAGDALKAAQSALVWAKKGGGANDITNLKQAAGYAAADLQTALEYCLK